MALRLTKAQARALAGKTRRGRFSVAPKADRTVDGIVFASKTEAQRYAELRLMQRAGLIRDLELQPRFPLAVNGVHLGHYTADFRYHCLRNSADIVEEVKSTATQRDREYRLRKNLAQALHGFTLLETVR